MRELRYKEANRPRKQTCRTYQRDVVIKRAKSFEITNSKRERDNVIEEERPVDRPNCSRERE